jgi:putative flavoprotein involved in K+ transport
MSDMTPVQENDPTVTAKTWLEEFAASLAAGDVEAVLGCFVDGGFWRDVLTFTWNIKTLEGKPAIRAMLEATLAATRPHAFALSRDATVSDGIVEAWFTFRTGVALGQGIVRLKGGKAWTLFTTMQDLAGHEEPVGRRRPLGATHRADRNRETWLEQRQRESAALGRAVQPYCLIIGGGQGGIALAARLKQLGVPALIVEKNPRAGDSWRNRYRSLVLHDPVWFDHLPYIPFPPNWPVFTPKDKMGDWLEMYVKVMELDYWAGTSCDRAAYDPERQRWTVEVVRDGETITLEPSQLVFATGAYGPPRRLALPGEDVFKGRIIHSSEHDDGRDHAGMKCAVLGTASSGHDVAVDLWEGGAEVTMLQRHPTTVVKSETLMELGFASFSEEAVERGITTEIADLLFASTPLRVAEVQQRRLWRQIRERDADYYAALTRAGFAIDFGEDETGLMMKAWRTGSGYYIDVGASQLIIDGKVKVRSGVEIERLTETGIRLSDGSTVEADLIVQCTGYHSMHETVAEIVSRAVADKVGPCWGLGSGVRNDPGPWQGELRNMYKPTAQEALWFHGGNLALSRYYSKILALQLKARMEGIPTPVYQMPG